MASKYWIKVYHETIDDPKTAKLPDNLWRRFFELCLLAGETDQSGYLPDTESIAWRLRIDEDTLKAELGQLAMLGFVELGLDEQDNEAWVVSNFAKRQHAMSNSKRAKLWRDKYKDTQWALPLYKDLPSTPGVYRITCTKTGMSYIGATNNLQTRTKQHLYSISKDNHPMAEDVTVYGVETVKIEILEHVTDESELSKKEEEYISNYPTSDLYNSTKPSKHHAWANDSFGNRLTDKDKDTDTDTDKTPRTPQHEYFPPEVQKILDALTEITKTAFDADVFSDATYQLVGHDATPEEVKGFAGWWKRNGYYKGKPAVKSILTEWNNYKSGETVAGESGANIEEIYETIRKAHMRNKQKELPPNLLKAYKALGSVSRFTALKPGFEVAQYKRELAQHV